MESLIADLRFAVRSLRKAPGFTAAAILTLALGIGANTAIFSAVDAVLFRPLPFPDGGRLVLVGEGLPAFSAANLGTIADADFPDYRALDGSVFESSAAFESTAETLTGEETPEWVTGLQVSPSLLTVLGAHPGLGRDFQPADTAPGAPDVVMLSDALWRRRFGGDRGVLGRSIVLDGHPARVIGVFPPEVVFPLPGLGADPADFFIPFRVTPFALSHRSDAYDAFMIARLKSGVSLTQARAAVNAVATGLPAKYPAAYGPSFRIIADALPLRAQAVAGVRGSLLLLLGAVACVLLIACINVSALLLARAAARARDAAVRSALGAGRARLVRQFFAEGVVLAGAGALAGLLLARWGGAALRALAPAGQGPGFETDLGGRVLAFTGLAAVFAVAFSLVPALQPASVSLTARLRGEGRGTSAGRERQRGRRALVISELALALVVVTGAGLLVRSLVNAERVDPGFAPEHVLAFETILPSYRYSSPSSVLRADQEILAALRRIPSVRAAAAAVNVPMAAYWHTAMSPEGVSLPRVPLTVTNMVLPGYFETVGIRLIAGRSFTDADREGSPPVAMIDEGYAARYFPKGGAVGRRIKWGSPSSADPWMTIVGVVGTVKTRSLDEDPVPETYLPALQFAGDSSFAGGMLRGLHYVARTAGDPRGILAEVRTAIAAVDPQLPITDVHSGLSLVASSLESRRFELTLLAMFAGLAIVLAGVGLYGLIAYSVVQRRREVGVRLALGASPREIVRLVLQDGVGTALAGAGLGLAGAILATRLMRSLLFGVGPLDGATLAAATGLLVAIALLACYLPARRAARTDPIVALTAE